MFKHLASRLPLLAALVSLVQIGSRAASIAQSVALCADGSPAWNVSVSMLDGSQLVQKTCQVPVTNASLAQNDPGVQLSPLQLDHASVKIDQLEKRANWNTCGGPCTTWCNTPAGGGPDPNDCSAMAATIRSANQFYSIAPNSQFSWSWRSCRIIINNILPNKDGQVSYCGTQIADIADFVAWNCQSAQNAHGGSCHFYNDNPVVGLVGIETA